MKTQSGRALVNACSPRVLPPTAPHPIPRRQSRLPHAGFPLPFGLQPACPFTPFAPHALRMRSFCLETLPEYSEERNKGGYDAFQWIETVTVQIFAADYLLRYAPHNPIPHPLKTTAAAADPVLPVAKLLAWALRCARCSWRGCSAAVRYTLWGPLPCRIAHRRMYAPACRIAQLTEH